MVSGPGYGQNKQPVTLQEAIKERVLGGRIVDLKSAPGRLVFEIETGQEKMVMLEIGFGLSALVHPTSVEVEPVLNLSISEPI